MWLARLHPDSGSMALHGGRIWLGLVQHVFLGVACGALKLRPQPVWGFEKLPALWIDRVVIDKADKVSAGLKPAALLAFSVQKRPLYAAFAEIPLGAIGFALVVEVKCFSVCICVKFGRRHGVLREGWAKRRAKAKGHDEKQNTHNKYNAMI